MSRPHIKLTPRLLLTHFDGGRFRWCCTGDGVMEYGHNPSGAYLAWKKSVRWRKDRMAGLRWVEHRRGGYADPRIVDRL